jgi:hypothetical protein
MGLFGDLYTLITRGWYYAHTDRALSERRHWRHDMRHGALVGLKEEGYTYADLHAHFYDTVNIQRLVEEAAQRVDLLAIVEREQKDNAEHLTFDRVLEKLDAKGLEYELLRDRVVRVETSHGPLHLVRSIEVYATDPQTATKRGVVIVGSDGKYTAWHDRTVTLTETLDAVRESGAFWFFDHQASKQAPLMAFRYPTKEEEIADTDLNRQLVPVLEVGNHQNTWWMYASNCATHDMADNLGLVGIANSDTHFNYRETGLSRTGIPSGLVDLTSETTILTSLRTALHPSNKDQLRVESNYASNWDFGRYMFATGLPFIKKIVKKRLRQKDFLEDLVVHNDAESSEVVSVYANKDLLQARLLEYNSEDTLVVIDLDDCVRDSPAKQMAFKSGWKYAPFRTFAWLFGFGPLAGVGEIFRHRNIKAGETKVFAAYRDTVYDKIGENQQSALALEALSKTPFYDGAVDFVKYFSGAHSIVVSRNVQSIVDPTVRDLGCSEGYAKQDDKIATIMDAAKGKKRVLIVGDSKEDAAVIPSLRAQGYEVDFVYVQKQYNPSKIHPDATVAITRNAYTSLLDIVAQQ